MNLVYPVDSPLVGLCAVVPEGRSNAPVEVFAVSDTAAGVTTTLSNADAIISPSASNSSAIIFDLLAIRVDTSPLFLKR